MRTDLFDFDLPADRIALRPVSPRDAARLLVVRPGEAAELEDRNVADLPDLLAAGRLPGGQRQQGDRGPAYRAGGSGGARPSPRSRRRCTSGSTARTGGPSSSAPRRSQVGDTLRFGTEGKVCFLGELDAQVSQKDEGGEVTLSFSFHGPVLDQAIAERGAMPLPPYIASRRAPGRAGPRRLSDHVRRATRARWRRRPPACISPKGCWRGSRRAASPSTK